MSDFKELLQAYDKESFSAVKTAALFPGDEERTKKAYEGAYAARAALVKCYDELATSVRGPCRIEVTPC